MIKLLRSGLLAAALGAGCVTAEPVADVDVDYGPPADVIATLSPVYYNGVPAYWWGGHWYYRNGAAWRYYRSEPGYLHDYRARGPAVYAHRAYYGRPRAAVVVHGHR